MGDMSFVSISVLAEWGSEAEYFLETASGVEISLMEERLRKMFVEKPINEDTRKAILKKNDDRKEWMLAKRNEYKGNMDGWWRTYPFNIKFENGIRACNECLELLDDF